MSVGSAKYLEDSWNIKISNIENAFKRKVPKTVKPEQVRPSGFNRKPKTFQIKKLINLTELGVFHQNDMNKWFAIRRDFRIFVHNGYWIHMHSNPAMPYWKMQLKWLKKINTQEKNLYICNYLKKEDWYL